MVDTKKVNICGIDFTVQEIPSNARDDTFMACCYIYHIFSVAYVATLHRQTFENLLY